MNYMLNYADKASPVLNSKIENLDNLLKMLDEKIGDESKGKKSACNVMYFIGMIACIILIFSYNKIDLSPAYDEAGYFVVFATGISCGMYLGLLLLRNKAEEKYYKVIFIGKSEITKIRERMEFCINNSGKGLEKLCRNGMETGYDIEISVGEDYDSTISKINYAVFSIEKNKSERINGLLKCVYFLAAFSVGTMLVLLCQNYVVDLTVGLASSFGIDDNNVTDLGQTLYDLCAFAGVILGPIVAYLYIVRVKLLKISDGAIFLILFSGIAGFIAALTTIVIIAAIIAIVVMVVKFMVELVLTAIAMVIVIVVIIGIIFGLLSGG